MFLSNRCDGGSDIFTPSVILSFSVSFLTWTWRQPFFPPSRVFYWGSAPQRVDSLASISLHRSSSPSVFHLPSLAANYNLLQHSWVREEEEEVSGINIPQLSAGNPFIPLSAASLCFSKFPRLFGGSQEIWAWEWLAVSGEQKHAVLTCEVQIMEMQCRHGRVSASKCIMVNVGTDWIFSQVFTSRIGPKRRGGGVSSGPQICFISWWFCPLFSGFLSELSGFQWSLWLVWTLELVGLFCFVIYFLLMSKPIQKSFFDDHFLCFRQKSQFKWKK